MRTEIVDARDAQQVVRSLFALYIHDLSDMAGVDIQEDGRFAMPPSLAQYWDGPEATLRFPFLIRADGALAGFALVRRIAADTRDMGEFFVLKKFRRAGVGRAAACTLFDRFPGNWEVRELTANTPAQGFWRRIIGDYTGCKFEERREFFEAYGREFVVQRFRSG